MGRRIRGTDSFTYTVADTLGLVSNVATVVITVQVSATPPTILTHPGSVVVTEPDPATFVVVANGTPPLSYQWRRNGTPIPGAMTATYIVTPTSVTTDHGAQFDVVVSNAGGSVTSAVATLTVLSAPTGGVFQQDSGAEGIVSLEVEHFHTHVPRSGYSWVLTTPGGESGTGALEALPNLESLFDSNFESVSPQLDFQVNFVQTGTHYVWVRGFGPSRSDDSLHMGLDGQGLASSDRIDGFSSNWKWSQSTRDGVVATIEVLTPGVHTVNIWNREDGFIVDKVVLTTNPSSRVSVPNWTIR